MSVGVVGPATTPSRIIPTTSQSPSALQLILHSERRVTHNRRRLERKRRRQPQRDCYVQSPLARPAAGSRSCGTLVNEPLSLVGSYRGVADRCAQGLLLPPPVNPWPGPRPAGRSRWTSRRGYLRARSRASSQAVHAPSGPLTGPEIYSEWARVGNHRLGSHTHPFRRVTPDRPAARRGRPVFGPRPPAAGRPG